MSGIGASTPCLTLLSQLLLDPSDSAGFSVPADGAFGPEFFSELWDLANSHHVIMRAFPRLAGLTATGSVQAEWVGRAATKELQRIQHALSFLSPICEALEDAGDVVVIKSLDHWPDLGNDLDLYTNAQAADVVAIMRQRFRARVDERSWGDRLANKWNFIVPGLPELVEVHIGRLGQMGEQIAITRSLITRSSDRQFGSITFRVPAPEDRIVISTLQRMYRHFYIRLCDIVDNAALIESGTLDYQYLKSLAASAGLWDGLASYLAIVSGYVESYRGVGVSLPDLVADAAQLSNRSIRFKRKFLRIPIFPRAAGFYASEWKRLLLNGEVRNTLRLSLLPGLATAAALELKITGSDKGIW
jgi:Uncharacterised nucleotidyltransferase